MRSSPSSLSRVSSTNACAVGISFCSFRRISSSCSDDDLKDVKDFPELSLHDAKLHIHERPVDGRPAASCFGPGFQGDLVAVALDPLPNGELPFLSLRDAQEQFSGFATLQGEGETDALNSSNSREESE